MRRSNRKGLLAGCALSAIFAIGAGAHAATFNGNGASGFSGAVGLGTLAVTTSGGNVTFTLTPGGALNDEAVLYIDSSPGSEDLSTTDSPGYYASNATLADNNGYGQQTAITGYDNGNHPLITFAPGFLADYAITIDNGTFDVFALPSLITAPGNGSLQFVDYHADNNGDGTYGATIPLSEIGVGASGVFQFEGTYISNTAYLSNETFGTSVTVPPGSDPGFSGSLSFASANTVPEPASLGLLGAASALTLLRRRRSSMCLTQK